MDLESILSKYEFITNALLFGSYASGTQNRLSDVDIALHVNKEIDLFAIGEIISDLETTLDKKVDLVILNELYKKSPLLAYNIYKNHKPIFIGDIEQYKGFKINSLHYFMDFKHVIDEQNDAFRQRIKDGNLAKAQTA